MVFKNILVLYKISIYEHFYQTVNTGNPIEHEMDRFKETHKTQKYLAELIVLALVKLYCR